MPDWPCVEQENQHLWLALWRKPRMLRLISHLGWFSYGHLNLAKTKPDPWQNDRIPWIWIYGKNQIKIHHGCISVLPIVPLWYWNWLSLISMCAFVVVSQSWYIYSWWTVRSHCNRMRIWHNAIPQKIPKKMYWLFTYIFCFVMFTYLCGGGLYWKLLIALITFLLIIYLRM